MTTLPQTTSIRMPRPGGQGSLAVGGGAGAVQPVATGMSPGDVWRVIRAHSWLILISIILGLLIGYFGNMYLAKNYSRYTATGWVQIMEKRSGRVEGEGLIYELDTTTLNVEQRSQALMLRTDALLNAVLSRPTVRETSWFRQFLHTGPDGTPVADIPAAKADLEDKLSVTPEVDSKLIGITFTYSNPSDCSTIINELVDEHLADQNSIQADVLRSRTQDLNLTKSSLTLKDNRLKEDIAKLQGELNSKGIMTGPNRISERDLEMQALGTQESRARDEYSTAKAQLDILTDHLKNGEDPPEVDEKISEDMRLQSLHSQIDELSSELGSLSNYGENNTQYRSAQQRLSMLQKEADDVEAERRVKLREEVKQKLEQEEQAAQNTLTSVQQKIEDNKNELGELDYKLFEFYQEKLEQEATDVQLQNVDKQIDDAQSQTRDKDLATVGWSQRPATPDTPSFPKLPWSLGFGVGLGLLLSLGLAFGRELMDQSVRSPRDITRVGQMTFLGMIPHEDDDPQVANVPLPLVIASAPTSVIAEQFRQVRTRLQHASSLETTRSLLITSPGPGDGKTTVACNIAAGLALNGRRILLVDANFRRPEIHKIFKVGNEMGFSSALAAIENFETAVHQTSVMNLDILPTGPKPANPTELMESQLLIDFIEKALEEYDHVIFDSGPLLFVSETVALAPRVDGVVTVVRARANSRGLLQRMRDGLRQLKAEHLGIILNAVRSQGGGYYGRNIKTYYEYQNGHSH